MDSGSPRESRFGKETAAKLELRPRDGQFWGPESVNQSFIVAQDIPIGSGQPSLVALNEGSRHLSRLISMPLSPASVRNVMQDLEELGLIYAPHTSAGRLPTELGLRFFVDALMQIGDLSDGDRAAIEGKVAAAGKSVENVLSEASGLLSGLTHAAGVVLTAKSNVRLKHIEFVRLEPERALVVLELDVLEPH